MSKQIEYNGYVIEPTTRLKQEPYGWTLEVRITPAKGREKIRRCRAPNRYPSKDLAVKHSLEFGRRIVDGKLQPRVESNS